MKNFNFINLFSEIELYRLFRTDAYNTAERKNPDFHKNMQENEIIQLHGPKMLPRRKLLRNSPLPYQLVYTECDFRLLALGDFSYLSLKKKNL